MSFLLRFKSSIDRLGQKHFGNNYPYADFKKAKVYKKLDRNIFK